MGFWLGGLKYKSLSLGPVTATLIVGVILGQLDIPVSETLKNVSFMLFLFAIGYSVGPQFFRSLRGEGLRQIGFALMEVTLCIVTVIVVCMIMGYDKGMAVGLFSGSQAFSAVIGVGSSTIKSLGLDPELQEQYLSIIPACYAVCYVFGTIGSAWIIANLGPVLLGGLKKAKEQTAQLEEEMDSGDVASAPGTFVANRPISFRAYKCESAYFNRPRSVDEINRHINALGVRHFIERLRVKGEILEPEPGVKVGKGDIIVLSGRRESIIDNAGWIGPEITDHDLLNFAAEYIPVTVSKSRAAGMTVGNLRNQDYMHGVMIYKIMRNDVRIPVRSRTKLERGDVITLVGLPQDVSVAESEIGYSDRPSEVTDMVFIGLGIAIGCLVGALTVKFQGIPISLSMSGGVILAGPTFLSGLKAVGFEMFLAGIVCTSVPLILSIIIGSKLF